VPAVTVSDTAGTQHFSSAQADILLDLPDRSAKIMPSFQHNLMGIGKLCDNDCRVVFDKTTVTAIHSSIKVIIDNQPFSTSPSHVLSQSILRQTSIFSRGRSTRHQTSVLSMAPANMALHDFAVLLPIRFIALRHLLPGISYKSKSWK
jgi:hypothetical protein